MCGFPQRFNLGILVDLDVFPAFSDAKICEIRGVIAICVINTYVISHRGHPYSILPSLAHSSSIQKVNVLTLSLILNSSDDGMLLFGLLTCRYSERIRRSVSVPK
jgi:hypothetical protein